jgi:DNA processing protein
MHDLNKNVAVIGLVDPTEEIEKREIEVVKRLVNNDLVVLSGLAKGCDAIVIKSV